MLCLYLYKTLEIITDAGTYDSKSKVCHHVPTNIHPTRLFTAPKTNSSPDMSAIFWHHNWWGIIWWSIIFAIHTLLFLENNYNQFCASKLCST